MGSLDIIDFPAKTESSLLQEDIDEAVKKLLALKLAYKEKTGQDPPGGRQPKSKEKKSKQDKKEKKKEKMEAVEEGSSKKQTRLGMEADKWQNLSDWYSQVRSLKGPGTRVADSD